MSKTVGMDLLSWDRSQHPCCPWKGRFFTPLLLYQTERTWVPGPFERWEVARQILQKDSPSVFLVPLLGKEAPWESMATFNPAAIVRNNGIFMLYRTEEKLGKGKSGTIGPGSGSKCWATGPSLW